MPARRTSRNRIGRRTMRALNRMVPDFHDLDLGLDAGDLIADLRPGLPFGKSETR